MKSNTCRSKSSIQKLFNDDLVLFLQVMYSNFVLCVSLLAELHANPTSGVSSGTYYDPEYNHVLPLHQHSSPSAPPFNPPVYPPKVYAPPSYFKTPYSSPRQNCSVLDEVLRADICTPSFKTICEEDTFTIKVDWKCFTRAKVFVLFSSFSSAIFQKYCCARVCYIKVL